MTLYSPSLPPSSTPYAYRPNTFGFGAAFGASASFSGASSVLGTVSAFSFQSMLQSTQSLGQGWAGFMGGGSFTQMQNYGLGGRFAPQMGAYSNMGSFGAQHPFAPFCPPGMGWSQGSIQGQLNLEFGFQQIPGESSKMWDVWFDSKDGQKTVQRSPIVLDLNKNGQADITGKNITGDGKIDGPTTLFDLDPDNVSYEFKSEQRRPGSGAPDLKGGYWVDADGKKIKGGVPKGKKPKYNGYQYLDKSGKVVGEMKDGLYHYGKQEKREITEWLSKNGGDGFLVADFNGDGEINSALELFGTEGTQGEKYANGYEKLAALFDKNRDGQVQGAELSGLQVWVDSNADGKVQDGELQSLQEHNITSFDVGNYNGETMEGSYTLGGGVAPYFHLSGSLFGNYNYGYAAPPTYGYY